MRESIAIVQSGNNEDLSRGCGREAGTLGRTPECADSVEPTGLCHWSCVCVCVCVGVEVITVGIYRVPSMWLGPLEHLLYSSPSFCKKETVFIL